MQRMNMLYSDLYNVLLLLFIILAIGRLIFHLRRLIFLLAGYMKNKEVTALKNKIKGLTSSNEVLKEKLEDQDNKLKDAKVDKCVALESKAALEQEVTALKHKIKGLTSSNEVLKEKLEDQVNKLKDAKVDKCVALESKAALEQEVTALKNKIKGLTSSNEVLKEKLEDQVNKLKDAKVDRCVALESNAALEQEEISITKSQCLDLERKNCLLQEEIKSLRTKMVTSSQEAADAGKFNEEYMKRLGNENESYRREISNTAGKIQKLAYTIQEQENVKNILSNYLRAAHEKLAAAGEEISKTKSQCLDLERKNCLQQEENESLRTKLVTSSQEAAEAGRFNEEDMKRLSNENESYRRQISNTAVKIQKLSNTIREQEKVNNILSNNLRAAHEKLAAAEDRVIYKSRQAGDITVLRYSSCPAMRMSDHKPLFVVFDVRVRPGGDNFALAPGQFNSQVYTEALKRRSRAGQARNTTVPAT